MSTYNLTGSGLQALSSGVGALTMTVTVDPAVFGIGRAVPANWYDIGLLRLMQGQYAYPAIPIDAQDQIIAVPTGCDYLGYSLFGGTHLTVNEVIGANPFSGPTGPTGPAGPSGSPGASGVVTHSYIGHNAIGASTEALVSYRQIMKKVTPSESGLLLAIAAYATLGVAGGATPDVRVGVLADSSGVPGEVLASGGAGGAFGIYPDATAHWYSVPVSLYLTSGTPYWLAWVMATAAAGMTINYDSGGTDQYEASTFLAIYAGDHYSRTTTSHEYSIRGDFLY